MNRVILVSNRLPVTVTIADEGVRIERSIGGLATALREPHERSGGLWIGWPGPTEGLQARDLANVEARFSELGTVPVHLSTQELGTFYEGFANGMVWPLFHYITADLPLRIEGWDSYREVNERFADVVASHHQPGDLIWVHDYQLMLVPGMVRERVPDARIGFFLHIPFPSSELFAVLPRREEILQGLLGADLIGFHTSWYERHFVSSVLRILGLPAHERTIPVQGRTVRLDVFPISVDAQSYQDRSQTPEVDEEVARLRGNGEVKLLVGIDRLDYTKGIPRRLLAFEHLLSCWPEWRGKVKLIQVAVPSRTGVRAYRRFRQEVEALVGHINGLFTTPHWTPVHYLYHSVTETELLALYRAADVMLVTPVRDGMNLVCKEFVATRADEDGVLVLSEFAGAAAQLKQAVLVNPYDVEDAAAQYRAALTMHRDERQRRMRALRQSVFDYDVHRWAREFLAALAAAQPVYAR